MVEETNNKGTGNSVNSSANKTNNSNASANFSYEIENNDVEEENRSLRNTVSMLNQEIERMRSNPLLLADVIDLTKDGIVIRLPNGNKLLVNSPSDMKLEREDTVLVEQKNLNIIRKIDISKSFDVEKFLIIEKPNTDWTRVGGLASQINEIQEVVELPLKKPELFKKIGIEPPKGVLLYGPPGTGKTLLAKAVASSSKSTFLEIVGSELVQKFIGEGAKMVKEIFDLARKMSPSIIFIDEIDAIAATRLEIGTSGEREVQRTFMQLLAEIDGFKALDNVKIIGATNRLDILDNAIIRPGRLDRMIEVPLPNLEARKEVFNIYLKDMSIDREGKDKINTHELADLTETMSGAQIKAICTEAGYFAIRQNKRKVTKQNFLDAVQKIKSKQSEELDKKMFG